VGSCLAAGSPRKLFYNEKSSTDGKLSCFEKLILMEVVLMEVSCLGGSCLGGMGLFILMGGGSHPINT
jgi:hypothetical protein